MKRISIVVLMALTLAVASIAQPVPDKDPVQGPPRGARRAQMREAIMEKLQLTDQQKDQFSKLRLDMERKREQNQSKIKLARIDLRELAQADSPDKAAIEKKLKEISDLQHQAKLAMVDHLFAAKALLTPEQQKVWKEHMRAGLSGMKGMDRPMMKGMMRGMRQGMRGQMHGRGEAPSME